MSIASVICRTCCTDNVRYSGARVQIVRPKLETGSEFERDTLTLASSSLARVGRLEEADVELDRPGVYSERSAPCPLEVPTSSGDVCGSCDSCACMTGRRADELDAMPARLEVALCSCSHRKTVNSQRRLQP